MLPARGEKLSKGYFMESSVRNMSPTNDGGSDVTDEVSRSWKRCTASARMRNAGRSVQAGCPLGKSRDGLSCSRDNLFPSKGYVDEPAPAVKTAMGLIRDGSRRSDPPSDSGGTSGRYAMLLLGLAMVGTLVPNLVLPRDNYSGCSL